MDLAVVQKETMLIEKLFSIRIHSGIINLVGLADADADADADFIGFSRAKKGSWRPWQVQTKHIWDASWDILSFLIIQHNFLTFWSIFDQKLSEYIIFLPFEYQKGKNPGRENVFKTFIYLDNFCH